MECCIMKQSCWSCKHCINDYFATGTMDCKKQDDMTEDEFENYYGDNGGENCTYYEEDVRQDQLFNRNITTGEGETKFYK